jgi:iron complex outermembrane recepter protein
MSKLAIFIYFIVILSGTGFSQTLSGKVIDKETGASIPFARISIEELHLNTRTDEQGVFKITSLPLAQLRLKVTMLDYETFLERILIEENTTITVQLKSKHTVFEEHIVSAAEGKLQKDNITSIEYQSKEKLFESGASTLGEAIMNIPGVQQTTIGTGISRPVIRGLSGSRVVTYWNGLRIENQQWGEDHGMAASELGMKGVEVVKGPASLLYGADALGGVIHFMDEDYVTSDTKKISASSRFESNARATINEAGFQSNNGKLRFNVFGNYLSYTDFQLPDGRYLENSRFWASNAKASMGYRHKNYVLNIRYHATLSKLGLPGHTHNITPDPEVFISNRRGLRGPLLPRQEIFNQFLQLDNKLLFKRSDLSFLLGQTLNHLREFEHSREIAFTNLRLSNSVYNIRYNHHLSDKLNVSIGAQGMVQINRNLFPVESFLIPDANTLDNGVYIVSSYETRKWRFQTGARFDYRSIQSLEIPKDTSLFMDIDTSVIRRSFATLNYSAGAVYNSKRATIRANVSSGFRAPHMAELLANGVHHGSMRYERGDRTLKAEQGIQLDAALELHFDHLEIIINPYFSALQNFVYLRLTDSFATNQVGTFPIFQFSQVNQAFLYGGEAAFHYHPHKLHRLHIESNFSITLAQDNQGNFINLIPQPNANTRLRFDVNNKGKFQIKSITAEHQYFMQQNRVAVFETTAPAFHLVHLAINSSIQLKHPILFSFGVRNLLNQEYIWHLSPLKNLGGGVPQPGINFFAKLRYEFEWQKNKS